METLGIGTVTEIIMVILEDIIMMEVEVMVDIKIMKILIVMETRKVVM